MKTLPLQLKDFFNAHTGQVFESGELQRMVWHNKNGTIAEPRTVVRRLQELAEDGFLKNVGNIHSARYMLASEPPRKPQVVFKEVNGQRIAVINY